MKDMADLVVNKKAGLNYELLDKYEAGIELLGTEVKSIRSGQGSLLGARVIVRGHQAYLIGAHIPPWQLANAPIDYDPDRTRRLLLTDKELDRLIGLEAKAGLTLIPLSLYNKGKFIKLKLAVARGKKQADKRQALRAKEAKKEAARTLKKQLKSSY